MFYYLYLNIYIIWKKDEKVNLALNQLIEILNIIFSDENNIKLDEEINFFQILRLLIDKYNEDEIKIFSHFIINIIKKHKDKLKEFKNFLDNFIYDEKFINFFKQEINEIFEKQTLINNLPLKYFFFHNNNLGDLKQKYINDLDFSHLCQEIINSKEIYFERLTENYCYLLRKKENVTENNFDETYGNLMNNKIEISTTFTNENILMLKKIIIYNNLNINKNKSFDSQLIQIIKFLIGKYQDFLKKKHYKSVNEYCQHLIFLLLFIIGEENKNKTKKELEEIINKQIQFNYFENIKTFKKIKRNLFSWNNPYSDIDIFYNSTNIKFKIYYYLTKEIVCHLLKPIIDLITYNTKLNKFNIILIFFTLLMLLMIFILKLFTF